MTACEAKLIETVIEIVRPRRCLEWGIGGSTVAFSGAASIVEWIGIEHNLSWVERVQPYVGPHVRLVTAPLSTGELKYGSPELVRGYVEHPIIQRAFDLIFIDGDFRSQCLEQASRILSISGLCLVHDSARKYMHAHFRHFNGYRILTDGEFNGNQDWHQGLTILWNNSSFAVEVLQHLSTTHQLTGLEVRM